MQAQFTPQTVTGVAASPSEASHLKFSHLLYQAATVLAILLFLVSF
jgi:hypothetical protein